MDANRRDIWVYLSEQFHTASEICNSPIQLAHWPYPLLLEKVFSVVSREYFQS